MLSEVSGERYLCGVTGKKGRKPVDELTRGIVIETLIYIIEASINEKLYVKYLIKDILPCQLVYLSTCLSSFASFFPLRNASIWL